MNTLDEKIKIERESLEAEIFPRERMEHAEKLASLEKEKSAKLNTISRLKSCGGSMDGNKVERLMKKCQIGIHSRSSIAEANDILSDCYGTIGLLYKTINEIEIKLKDIVSDLDNKE